MNQASSKLISFFIFLSIFFFCVNGLVSASEEKNQKKAPENVCIDCHSELGGSLTEPVRLWEQSYHAKMGNNCEGCHGGDPSDAELAMDPSKGFIGVPKPSQVADFCGKCHVGVKENYLKSPHYLARLSGREAPTCVTCHNSHDVYQASIDMIKESLCSRCHSYDQAQTIKNSFKTTESKLEEENHFLHYLEKRGMDVRRQKEKFFALRNSLHQLTHTLDVELIKNKTDSVVQDLEDIHKESIELNKKVLKRLLMGGAIALFFLVTAFVIKSFKKIFENE